MTEMRLEVQTALASRGYDIRDLLVCPDVVLFGSRAVGCAHANSDWDVLLIGSARAVPRIPDFDVVTMGVSGTKTASDWHSTELAIHIRRYGVWLVGAPPDEWHIDFARVVARKSHVLDVRLGALRSVWSSLDSVRRRREVLLLRRDLQRLQLLRQGEAVPPRQYLDEAWGQGGGDLAPLCGGLETCVAELRSWLSPD
jgi:hypothetical protein